MMKMKRPLIVLITLSLVCAAFAAAQDQDAETFSYRKPVDMSGAVQSLRAEIAALGGEFTGDEREGVFSGIGAEGSYRVTSDQLIITIVQRWKVKAGPGSKAAGYQFTFDKPGNIAEAVNTVKTGVTAKGGKFNGNEEAGSFQAAGIAGEYRVIDKVNVTILEKPFVIPASMIEKEVKNFFGVR